MEFFYLIVLIIAVVFLIITLVFVGYMMTNAALNKTNYPPLANTCPDFWDATTDLSGNVVCVVPDAGFDNLGTFTIDSASDSPVTYGVSMVGTQSTINFNNIGWSSGAKSRICGQNQWANTYGIAWDGVSNYTGC